MILAECLQNKLRSKNPNYSQTKHKCLERGAWMNFKSQYEEKLKQQLKNKKQCPQNILNQSSIYFLTITMNQSSSIFESIKKQIILMSMRIPSNRYHVQSNLMKIIGFLFLLTIIQSSFNFITNIYFLLALNQFCINFAFNQFCIHFVFISQDFISCYNKVQKKACLQAKLLAFNQNKIHRIINQFFLMRQCYSPLIKIRFNQKIIWFIINLLVFSGAFANDSCKNIKKNNCLLCYQEQNQPSFVNCTVSCSHQPLNSSISLFCINGAQYIQDQDQCISACCKSSLSLQQCLPKSSARLSTSMTSIIVVVSVLTISLILIAIIVIYFYKNSKSKRKVIEINKQGDIWWQKQLKTQIKGAILTTTQDIAQSNLNQEEQVAKTCSICLQDSFLNLRTICAHEFHSNCFANWVKKNQTCPLCMAKQYNPVTIQCQLCQQKSIRCRLYSSNSLLEKYLFFSLYQNLGIKCPECSKVKSKQVGKVDEFSKVDKIGKVLNKSFECQNKFFEFQDKHCEFMQRQIHNKQEQIEKQNQMVRQTEQNNQIIFSESSTYQLIVKEQRSRESNFRSTRLHDFDFQFHKEEYSKEQNEESIISQANQNNQDKLIGSIFNGNQIFYDEQINNQDNTFKNNRDQQEVKNDLEVQLVKVNVKSLLNKTYLRNNKNNRAKNIGQNKEKIQQSNDKIQYNNEQNNEKMRQSNEQMQQHNEKKNKVIRKQNNQVRQDKYNKNEQYNKLNNQNKQSNQSLKIVYSMGDCLQHSIQGIYSIFNKFISIII